MELIVNIMVKLTYLLSPIGVTVLLWFLLVGAFTFLVFLVSLFK